MREMLPGGMQEIIAQKWPKSKAAAVHQTLVEVAEVAKRGGIP
jgi:hypothetical protein